MNEISLKRRHYLAHLIFEFLLTLGWFSPIRVFPFLSLFLARCLPGDYVPNWGIKRYQYVFLPAIPLVTVAWSIIPAYGVYWLTSDAILFAGIFSYLYTQKIGIHADALADVQDAYYCSSDKWRASKDPLIGAMGAYHLNLQMTSFMGALVYLAFQMTDRPEILGMLVISLCLSRLNCFYLAEYFMARGLFKMDGILIETEMRAKNKGAILASILVAAGVVSLVGALFEISLESGVEYLAVVLVTTVVFNQAILKPKAKEVGFFSGDFCGYAIFVLDLIHIAVLLVLSARHILA